MKRLLVIILSLLAICLALGSCGGDGQSESESDILPFDPQGLSFREVDGAYAVSIGTQTNTADIEIPSTYNGKSVSRIDENGFKGATRLKSVIIPSTVRVIGESAFEGCTALTKVKIIEDDTDRRLTTIEKNAFKGCTSLKDVNIPSSVTSFDDGVLDNCPSLVLAKKDNGLYTGNSANPYMILVGVTDNTCTGFTAHIDTRIIHSGALSGCGSLKSVILPGGIISYGTDAFKDCAALDTVNYLGNAENWCNAVFYNASANPLHSGADLYMENALISNISVPNNITKINDFAFVGCNSIKSVTLPDDLYKIGKNAFDSCNQLESVALSNGIIEIGALAFKNCRSLTSVNLPSGIKSVGERIFDGCTALEHISCISSELPSTWNENWLDGCTATVTWGHSAN